jgi:predicted phosphohydrolase
MDLFGDHWANYESEIKKNWNAAVKESDIGIIAGDISWAMRMEDTEKDFNFIHSLNGTKIIIRGNHDYWWKSIGKIRDFVNTFPPHSGEAAVPGKKPLNSKIRDFVNTFSPQNPDIFVLQNDSVRIGGFVFVGTRGWHTPERRQTQTAEDKKIYDREILRFELSLQDAVKKIADLNNKGGNNADRNNADGAAGRPVKLIAILHYPPFNCMRDDSPFTALCEKYSVDAVVYGHLHGRGGRGDLVTVKNGIKYYLTSTDLLAHNPAEIKF